MGRENRRTEPNLTIWAVDGLRSLKLSWRMLDLVGLIGPLFYDSS